MNNIKSYSFVIDSKDNKYCFFYCKAAIFCKTRDANNLVKETILIDKVYNNFLCSISRDDIIYLLCQARNKDMLLFINREYGWHMNEIPVIKNIGALIPMCLFHLNDSIHIIYCSRLPIDNYYDVYHIIGKKDKWQKNNICELFSKNMHSNSFSILTKNNFINMVCTFFDGKQVSLKHYIFDAISEKWDNREIVNLQNSDIKVNLLSSDETLYLICYSIENEVLTLFIFKKYMDFDSPFILLDISKLKPFNGKDLIIFELEKNILKISYIEKNYYYLWNYDIYSKKLLINSQVSFDEKLSVSHVKMIKNSNSSEISYKDLICNIDDNLEIKALEVDLNNIETINKNESMERAKTNSTSCLMEQIDILTKKIMHLNERLNDMKINNYNEIISKYDENDYNHFNDSNNIIKSTLKQSKFRERFMRSKPISLKLDSTSLLSINNGNSFTPEINYNNDKDNDYKFQTDKSQKNNEESAENLNGNVIGQNKENKILKIIRQLLK